MTGRSDNSLIATAIAIAAASLFAGCAASPSPTAGMAPRRTLEAAPIAMPSSNLLLVAGDRLDSLEQVPEASRNDARLGRPLYDSFGEIAIDRRVWDRSAVVNGRTQSQYRAVIWQREVSIR